MRGLSGGFDTLNAPPHKLQRAERGVTGLETAIILIAFVVVASVFAFTVLSKAIAVAVACVGVNISTRSLPEGR